jgi:7,8-dihydro-6-hydroxymethylpterin dimethyltransferase
MGGESLFLEATQSLCLKCLQVVPAKIVIRQEHVWLQKWCAKHGEQEELFEEDATYYLARRLFDKPSDSFAPQTKRQRGCPFEASARTMTNIPASRSST